MTAVLATRVSGMITRSRARRVAVPVPKVPGMGTRSRAGMATDHDLRSTAMLKTTTKKDSTASVGAGIQKRKKPTSASVGVGAGKEAVAATRLWREMGVPGALERWVKAREEEARAEEARPKRRKMVLKTKLPEAVIDAIKLHPYRSIEPMADEDLANQTESFRELYAMVRLFDEKMNAYEQALIKQHDSKVYAEDETEVTYDDVDAQEN